MDLVVLLPLLMLCLLMALIPSVLVLKVRGLPRIMALVRVLWRGMFMFELACCFAACFGFGFSRIGVCIITSNIALMSNGRKKRSCILGPNSSLSLDEKWKKVIHQA
jgi:hypothetical protein